VSTIGPLAIGVMLAFGWNILTQPHDVAGGEPGITRQVGQTVDEVAAQAWASASPHAIPGGNTVPGNTVPGGSRPGDDSHPGQGGHAPARSGR
jgi:hypothetical protein